MTEFRIEFTEEARGDLLSYTAHERKIIATEIRAQLSHQPVLTTKNRKPLRTNPVAPWELRIGRFRVFYEADDSYRTVTIIAVGHKEHNVLFVRGQEVRL
jgi:mRNA-degrading endonuclease RelE of RelBE toxin-antitoxin system